MKSLELRLLICVVAFATTLGAEFRSPISLNLPRGYNHFPLPLDLKEDECALNWDVWAGAYYRQANEAYDQINPRQNKINLSALFFGTDSFTINQSLANQSAIVNGNIFTRTSTFKPKFEYSEKGVVFGFRMVKTFGCNDNLHVGLRVRLPYNLVENNLSNCCDLEGSDTPLNPECLDYLCAPETVTNNGITLQVDQVCAYRMDFLTALNADTDGTKLVNLRDPFKNNQVTIGLQVASFPSNANNSNQNAQTPFVFDSVPVNLLVADCSGPDHPWSSLTLSNAQDPSKTFPSLSASGAEALTAPKGTRYKFDSSVDYSQFATNIPAQKRLFLVPMVVPNDQNPANATNAVLASGANSIRTAIQRSINAFGSSAGIIAFFNATAVSFNWDNFKNAGLGDLDVQAYVGADCCWSYSELQFGILFPTGSKVKNSKQMLAVANGNNGHYEVKLGIEFGIDICPNFKFKTNNTYSFVLPGVERLNASFLGSPVKNFGPETCALKSWGYYWGRFDFSFYAPCKQETGINIGYELYAKQPDKITYLDPNAPVSKSSLINELTVMNDFAGNRGQLSPTVAALRSDQLSNKIRTELFYNASMANVFAGFSSIIAGKNMPKETEFYLGANTSF